MSEAAAEGDECNRRRKKRVYPNRRLSGGDELGDTSIVFDDKDPHDAILLLRRAKVKQCLPKGAAAEASRGAGVMWTMMALVAGALGAVAIVASPALGQVQGTDTVSIRGHAITVRTYGSRGGTPVVVTSGDGGWIHLGPHVADVLAARGYFVVGVDAAAASADELDTLRAAEHSRLLVVDGDPDNVVGVIYAKDLIASGAGDAQGDWHTLVRPVEFVPEAKRLDRQLRDFQRGGGHLVVVVDEFGGTSGIVTLEDVLEQVVGEIRDREGQGLLSLSIVLALWAASAGMRSVTNALNRAYDVDETRPIWQRYPLSVLYTVGLAALILLAAAARLAGPQVVERLTSRFGITGVVATLWTWLRWPAVVALLLLVVALAAAARSSVRFGLQAMTFMPKACAMRATCPPSCAC